MRRANEAIYVLLGAAIGASASLLGAYITIERQADLDLRATRRDAYAVFVAEANQVGRQLGRLQFVLIRDQEMYQEELNRLADASSELQVALSVVMLVSDGPIGRVGQEVIDAYALDFSSLDRADATKWYRDAAEVAGEARATGDLEVLEFIGVAKEDLAGGH